MAIIGKQLLSFSSLPWLALALLSYNLLRRLYVRFYHLQAFRGPKWAAYSRWWLVRTYASGDSADIFLEANRTYGKLTRVGPNHLLTDDPEINWRMLRPHSQYQRGKWFDSLRFDPHYSSIASETNPVKHDALRTKLSAGYATKEFHDLEQVIDNRLQEWLQRVRRRVSDGKLNEFDIGRSVRYMTLDVAAYICFSQGLMFNEDEADVFWDDMEQNAPYAQYLSCLHWLFSFTYNVIRIPALKRRMLLTEHNNPGIGRIIRVSRVAAEQRFGPDAKVVNDMLGSWVSRGLTLPEAETEASIALVTSAFPTAAAINVILLHIVTNLRIQKKLREEFDTAASQGLISTPIRNSEAIKLPFFQACVSEGMRLFPPITQLRERVVPAAGDTIDGDFIPGGTNIGINAKAMLRNPCFGPDPEMYRPERWLEADDERLDRMKKVHGLIFGYGSTKCLGILQASMIINKCLVEILRHFDMEITRPAKPWIDQQSGVSFHSEFYVRLEERGNGIEATSHGT